jgi:hypothetical protein
VPKSVGSVTTKDIHDFINSKVSSIKRLSGGVIFTDVIPKNPVSLIFSPDLQAYLECDTDLPWQSGKILRRLLRVDAEKLAAAQKAKL